MGTDRGPPLQVVLKKKRRKEITTKQNPQKTLCNPLGDRVKQPKAVAAAAAAAAAASSPSSPSPSTTIIW